MAWDHERERTADRVRSPALLRKPGPLARSKKDSPTFSKPDAYALVGRLAGTWHFLASEDRADALAGELLAQLDGYDPALVDEAATEAIGEAISGPPSPGAIKAKLRSKLVRETRPSERQGYRPTYDYSTLPHHLQGQEWVKRLIQQHCAPEYIVFRDRERYLYQQFLDHMKKMTPETMRKLGIDDDSIGQARKIMGGR